MPPMNVYWPLLMLLALAISVLGIVCAIVLYKPTMRTAESFLKQFE